MPYVWRKTLYCHRWNINAFRHINTSRESLQILEKFQVLKLKFFPFYRFWRHSHRGIRFAHIHLCTHCITTAYVTFPVRHVNSRASSEGHVQGADSFFIQHTACVRRCATNRKVAGSIPDGVIGIFYWHNPSDRTMALGSTQPLTFRHRASSI